MLSLKQLLLGSFLMSTCATVNAISVSEYKREVISIVNFINQTNDDMPEEKRVKSFLNDILDSCSSYSNAQLEILLIRLGSILDSSHLSKEYKINMLLPYIVKHEKNKEQASFFGNDFCKSGCMMLCAVFGYALAKISTP